MGVELGFAIDKGDYKDFAAKGIEKGALFGLAKGSQKYTGQTLKNQKAKPQTEPGLLKSEVDVSVPHWRNIENVKKAQKTHDRVNGLRGDMVRNGINYGSNKPIQNALKSDEKDEFDPKLYAETQQKISVLSNLLMKGAKTGDKTKNVIFETQFGYITLNYNGYCVITDDKDKATRWNEILYQNNYKQKYYQVASDPNNDGRWNKAYMSSHWDDGFCVYSKWGDCLYFGYERYRLRCKGGKCDSYSVKYRSKDKTLWCYYRTPEYQECLVIKQ